MGTVFGGLMARAFWTLGIPLNPLSPSQTSLAMARSRCSAREIKRFRETPVHAAVEGFLRAAAETHGPAEGPEPAVDVVVDTPAKIHRSKGVRCLCSTLNPPAGSLAEVGGCEAVCSLTPAQHFVVRARDLDPVGCCLLAMELCGTYLLRPDLPAGFATLPEPLVSVVDLAHQTGRNRGMPGARRALEALTHTCDGSASPMETAVVLLLVLPPELGGHGLPLPGSTRRSRYRRRPPGCWAAPGPCAPTSYGPTPGSTWSTTAAPSTPSTTPTAIGPGGAPSRPRASSLSR